MHPPPNYTYMNYGAPYLFQPGQPVTGVRYQYVPGQAQPGTFNPYYPYAQPINAQKQKGVKQPKQPNDQRVGCNSNYLSSPLGILRLLLIVSYVYLFIFCCC
jgi:hypothetical protein